MPPLARFGLEGKIVIVTGAGRGIGRTIALECAQSGAHIAVGSRTTTELETLAAEIEAAGGTCFHHKLDVTDVRSIERFMAAEWAEHQIRVNAVAPTVTRSPLAETAMRESQAFADAVKTKNLLRGALAEPEEMSAPVIFLASDAASMITGHTLVVDGGWTIV